MQVEIKEKRRVYDGFFKLDEVTVEHDRFDGSKQTVKRLCLERGDAVAAVVFDPKTHELLFTEQFRYGAYSRTGDPTLLEIVAGMMNPGESSDDCLEREIQEELGYTVRHKVYLGNYFLTPGGSSEAVHLYYVTLGEKNGNSGGRLDENEDIRVRRFTPAQMRELKINDAKTQLGLALSEQFWYNHS